uniref:sigma-70 family RNA polymerase sigma factor n=1 Tax=Acetivibrio cellulolyticus TaxID=35830 RepID=UPI0001E2D981|nr:sigma-70 family RNA polymerase sigma factor [Acetivibrio cellulolyticus]
MENSQIAKIIKEELLKAEERIIQRLTSDEPPQQSDPSTSPRKPLPGNDNYAKALASYLNGGTHSGTAKELGVSMAQVKKYYNWLVKHGYLEVENAELSEVEQHVVNCIYKKKMSLRETAQELECSVSNVTFRRDSAIRKGYVPEEPDAKK